MKKEIYNKNVITKGKRILSHLADAIIFLILSIVVYSFISLPIAQSVTPFKQFEETSIQSKADSLIIIQDSHLLSFDDEGNEVNIEEYFKENLSYKLDNFTYGNNNEYIDIFYYFYLDYSNNHLTFNNETSSYTIEYVNTNIYKYVDNQDLFTLTDDDINKPLDFKAEIKTHLKDYLDGNITAENLEIYVKYVEIFIDGLEFSIDVLISSDQYSEVANIYNSAFKSLLFIYSYTALITFVILFFIYYLLIPLLIGKGQTLAKKVLHIGVFSLDMKPIKPTFLVVRSLFQFIFYLHLLLFIPYMQLGMNIINLPLFDLGSSTFNFLPIASISGLLCLFDLIFMTSNINNRTIRDKVLDLIVLKDAPEIYDLTKETKADNVIEQEKFDRGSKF
jgi:uncharacterized RDD family membrane protein YckC